MFLKARACFERVAGGNANACGSVQRESADSAGARDSEATCFKFDRLGVHDDDHEDKAEAEDDACDVPDEEEKDDDDDDDNNDDGDALLSSYFWRPGPKSIS